MKEFLKDIWAYLRGFKEFRRKRISIRLATKFTPKQIDHMTADQYFEWVMKPQGFVKRAYAVKVLS